MLQLFSSYDGICAPILCKMEAAIVASCLVYNDGDGVIGPGSRLIHGDYGVDVGVRWDAEYSTALIAFRGTEVREVSLACCISSMHCCCRLYAHALMPKFSLGLTCTILSLVVLWFTSMHCCYRLHFCALLPNLVSSGPTCSIILLVVLWFTIMHCCYRRLYRYPRALLPNSSPLSLTCIILFLVVLWFTVCLGVTAECGGLDSEFPAVSTRHPIQYSAGEHVPRCPGAPWLLGAVSGCD